MNMSENVRAGLMTGSTVSCSTRTALTRGAHQGRFYDAGLLPRDVVSIGRPLMHLIRDQDGGGCDGIVI